MHDHRREIKPAEIQLNNFTPRRQAAGQRSQVTAPRQKTNKHSWERESDDDDGGEVEEPRTECVCSTETRAHLKLIRHAANFWLI